MAPRGQKRTGQLLDALTKLQELRVDVRLRAAVADADEHGVTLSTGDRINAGAVVWVAGLRAEPCFVIRPR